MLVSKRLKKGEIENEFKVFDPTHHASGVDAGTPTSFRITVYWMIITLIIVDGGRTCESNGMVAE